MAGQRFLGIRWITIALIMAGALINYLTRSTLGVAAADDKMFPDLGISKIEYSYVILAFQFAIMVQPLVGYILDTIGLRVGMFIFALTWSVSSIFHGFASNWQMLAGLRATMGFAEGSANPVGMKVVSVWFPAKERGFAAGLYNIGASVGSLLAAPLVTFAIWLGGWKIAFMITGAIGLLWAIVWVIFYRPPEQQKLLSEEERALISSGQEQHLKAEAKAPSVLRVLAQRNFWGIALPRFLADPTWGTLTFWLPLYFKEERGFDLKQIGMFLWLPFLAADIGCFCGPAIVHFLQKRGVSLIDARRWAFTIGALMMIGVMFTGLVTSPGVAIALICLAAFAHQTLSVTVITMASDLYKQNEVATVAGMAGTFGNLGLMIFSTLIGSLVFVFGYAPFFIALGVLDIVGAIVVWSLVREPAKNQTVPFVLPLAIGAALTFVMTSFVHTLQSEAGARYFVGAVVAGKTFYFYPWVYYLTWGSAIAFLIWGAVLLFNSTATTKPRAA